MRVIKPNASDVRVRDGGALRLEGTVSNPVVWEAETEDPPSNQGNRFGGTLWFEAASTGLVEYAVFDDLGGWDGCGSCPNYAALQIESDAVVVRDVEITGTSGNGIQINDVQPSLNRINLAGNTSGLNYSGASTLDAEWLYWGDASGPNHPTLNPNGQGNLVSDNVDFTPWRTSPVQIQNQVDPPSLFLSAASVAPGGWTDVTLPNGNPYGPVAGPVRLTVAAGATRQFTLRQTVPARAPAGSYTYTARTGSAYPATEQSDSFPFTKLPPAAATPPPEASLSAKPAAQPQLARAAPPQIKGSAETDAAAPVRPALEAGTAPTDNAFAFDPAEWPVVDVATGLPFGTEEAIARGTESATGETAALDTAPASLALPTEPALYPAYPNPFNRSATLRYDLARPGPVRLAVYDALGRRVALLVDEAQEPGRYRARFDASRLASGVYVVRMTTPDHVETHRLTLVR